MLHHLLKHGLEDVLVAPIVDTIEEWKVDAVVLAVVGANILFEQRAASGRVSEESPY